jgi:hypothetical protein
MQFASGAAIGDEVEQFDDRMAVESDYHITCQCDLRTISYVPISAFSQSRDILSEIQLFVLQK